MRGESNARGAGAASMAERALHELAARQHGVVSRQALLDLGMGSGAIDRRVARGRLVPLHRGVYLVGGAPLTSEARLMEALQACGPGAVLSHRSAGVLWGIVAAPPERVEISSPVVCRRPGIDAHRANLRPEELTTRRGFAVTTPSRTLLDLAARFAPERLQRSVEEAQVQRILDVAALERLLELHPRRAGTRALRIALERGGLLTETVVRSVFESAFAGCVTSVGLPPPRVNATLAVGGRSIEVDFSWPAERVAVELDGHATHGTRSGFERDRARDRALQVAGWRVVRITWRQFQRERDLIARDLRALLAAKPTGGDPER